MTGRPTTGLSRMTIGFDKPMVIELKKRVSHSQANILHILGEFPNRLVPMSDLCARTGLSVNGVRIHTCFLRRCLTSDWTVQCSRGAYRLIDLRDK